MRAISVLLLAILPMAALAVPTQQQRAKSIHLHNCTIADVDSLQWIPHVSIHIVGSQIRSVSIGADAAGSDEADSVVDCGGRFVIPGLMDGHVHVSSMAPDEQSAIASMQAALRGGITTVRDMGGDAIFIAPLSAHSTAEQGQMPSLYYSALMGGRHFFDDFRMTTVGHGFQQGMVPWLRKVERTTNFTAAAISAKAVGATGIKMYGDMEPEVLAAMGAAATAEGMRVWAHGAVFPAKPSDCVKGGVNVLSHSAYLVWEAMEAEHMPESYTARFNGHYSNTSYDHPSIKALFRSMISENRILDATVWVFSMIGTRDSADGEAYPWACNVTRLAREMGVMVSAGTDDMMPDPSESAVPNVHRELASLVDCAGFSPIEAVRAATLMVAKAIGVEERVGSIEKGKIADLIMLDASAQPNFNISHLQRIALVIKNGQIAHNASSIPAPLPAVSLSTSNPLPVLPQRYSALERVERGAGFDTVHIRHLYDSALQCERVDIPSDNITRIYRYDLGVEYVVDSSRNVCSQVALDVGALPPFAWQAHNASLAYRGARVVEGIECAVWEADDLAGAMTTFAVVADGEQAGNPKQIAVHSIRDHTTLVNQVYEQFDAKPQFTTEFDVPALCRK